eukprot:644625-Pleurochrysis_carterae.AAC.1
MCVRACERRVCARERASALQAPAPVLACARSACARASRTCWIMWMASSGAPQSLSQPLTESFLGGGIELSIVSAKRDSIEATSSADGGPVI